MAKWREEAILDLYSLVLAVLLFLTPWLFAVAEDVVRIEIWASSLLLALVSIATLVAFTQWEEWTSLFLGLWIVAAPWVLGFQHTSIMKISVGIGCAVTFLAALELWLIHYPPSHSMESKPSANRHEIYSRKAAQ